MGPFHIYTKQKHITMKFKQWLIELFKDERGSTSVKPVVALIGTLFLCVTMTLNSYTHEQFKPSPELVNAVLIITAVGMGADSIDKFSNKSKEKTENES